jgi:hypothetical protein
MNRISKSARKTKIKTVGEIAVIYLKEPREKMWGVLLEVSSSGVWFRGLELSAFEDFARQEASKSDSLVVPNTLFFPYLRVEKIIIDENIGKFPSFKNKFKEITGIDALERLLKNEL